MARFQCFACFPMVCWLYAFFCQNEVFSVKQGLFVNVSQTMCVSQMINATITSVNIYGCANACLQTKGGMCAGFSYSSDTKQCNTYGIRTNATLAAVHIDSSCFINSAIRQYFEPEYLLQPIPYGTSPNVNQSTTYQKDYPKFAFDGNVTSFSATEGVNEVKPWLGINLKEIYVIHQVVIINRDDKNNYGRFHDVEIRFGWRWPVDANDKQAFAALCGEHVGGGVGPAQKVNFKCSPYPLFGQYVFMQIMKLCPQSDKTCNEKSSNLINIGEFQIYGYPKAIF